MYSAQILDFTNRNLNNILAFDWTTKKWAGFEYSTIWQSDTSIVNNGLDGIIIG